MHAQILDRNVPGGQGCQLGVANNLGALTCLCGECLKADKALVLSLWLAVSSAHFVYVRLGVGASLL